MLEPLIGCKYANDAELLRKDEDDEVDDTQKMGNQGVFMLATNLQNVEGPQDCYF